MTAPAPEPDRYEKRANELEDALITKFEEGGELLSFWQRDDVITTREIIETFRKASKTYKNGDLHG